MKLIRVFSVFIKQEQQSGIHLNSPEIDQEFEMTINYRNMTVNCPDVHYHRKTASRGT